MRLLPFLKTSWFSCYDCNLKWIKSQEQIQLQEGGSKHETYFAIFYWQWRCHLCRAGHVSISRGEVSAYLQSVCIQIGFKHQPSVCCDAGTLGELASVAGDGWKLNKANLWIRSQPIEVTFLNRFKIPVPCHLSVSVFDVTLINVETWMIHNPQTKTNSACHPVGIVMGGLVSIFNCDWN